MLRVLKSTNRVASTANDHPTENSKGSVELSLRNSELGPTLKFEERGNYGKVRWSTLVQVTREEVEQMVRDGQDFLAGRVENTLSEQPQQPTPERDVAVTPEDKTTFELVNGNR